MIETSQSSCDSAAEEEKMKKDDKLFIAGIPLEILNKKLGIEASSLDAYLPMTTDKLRESEIKCITWSYFHNWHPQGNYYFTKKNSENFQLSKERTPGTYQKHASLDDKLDDLHYYTAYAKFGVGRAHYDASQETRSGDLDMEEARQLIRKFSGEYPKRFMKEIDRRSRKHTIAILVDNESGVLARVIGLFSGRGYNIESLTVAETDREKSLSRITIVTSGTPMVIEQIKAQLSRLVPVHRVSDLTTDGSAVERELAMIKVAGIGENRVESLRIADIFRARVVDSSRESFVFELTGKPSKIDAFIELMRSLGDTEISRTGVSAISRGNKTETKLLEQI